jgi:hypothetical protein
MLDFALILQETPDPTAVQHAALAVLAILPILILIGLAIVILPFWFICKKAGLSPWLSLINILPLGTPILLYVLAFSSWKVVPAPQFVWPVPPPFPPTPPTPPTPPQA